LIISGGGGGWGVEGGGLARPSPLIEFVLKSDRIFQQWLDPSKKIGKQLKPKKGDINPDAHTLYFCVKFYAADPCKLIEEITRYVVASRPRD
jgi:hypothetical protein